MKLPIKLLWAPTAFLLAIPAFGQEEAAPQGGEGETSVEMTDAEGKKTGDISAGIDEAELKTEQVKLSPDEMLDQANKMLANMRQSMSRAMEHLASARGSKDIIRLNCVNEKLTPMKGILKIAEDSLIALQEQVATGNVEGAGYEYSKIKISNEKINSLLMQSANCVGAEASYGGETEVTVDIDPDMVGADPYYGNPQILVDPSSTGGTTTDEVDDQQIDEPTVEGPDTRPPPVSCSGDC